ncbi:HlyD family efflux transporter periplasmic adaptor subunit [Oceanicaulis sp. AH-315-P02]|nr:HlyD family efflux transporter periplasmic adaptor subunit [Robiginitomaculum sp.]MBN4047687.1 HlyD family efflux transporter periplasmic adaptor subunit [Oceanicaulis sp. AH-315-P02]
MKYLLLTALVLLSNCQKSDPDTVLYGYIEGRPVHIAPLPTGKIIKLFVQEGEEVSSGQALFSIDPSRAKASLASAKSAQSAAQSRLADLQKSGRPEEIRAARQALTRHKSQLTLARENLERSKVLVSKKLSPTTRLETDQANFNSATAAVEEAKARLALLQQPARADQIASAHAEVARLHAQVTRAEIELDDHQISALQSAKVETIYRRAGELAGANQPVMALLPAENLRIRFYIPEPRLQEVSSGMEVSISCDNCPADLIANVTFIASQSEFTPPIIFTQKERSKLMWMVEAKPEFPHKFRIGQPVEIRW